MRLLKLHLENYINIYNGMGLKSLTIDFSKCRNKLLVIKGMNGSGKSSLFKSMSPFMDSSDVFMEDKEVKKQIIYALNDGTTLTITYTAYKGSKGNRNKPSRCSIIRSYPDGRSFELNENSNIISGKQIIYDMFDLDDNYITLSNISTTNKGLGDLTPHERKKYVGNILSAISDYNDMNKLFTSKVTVLKSLIKSMTVKMSQIGSIEMVQASIIQNEEKLKNMENEKDMLKTREVRLLSKLDEFTKDGNPVEIMKELTSKKNIIESRLSNLPIEDIEKCSDEKFLELSNKMTEYTTKLSILKEQANDLVEKETDLVNRLNETKIKLSSLFDQSILTSTEQRIDQLEKNVEFYKTCFNNIGFEEYENISEEEYSVVLESIECFNASLDKLCDDYPIHIRQESVKWLHTSYPEIDFISLKEKMQSQLDEIKSVIIEDDILVKKSEGQSKIPTECNIAHKCPFVYDIVMAEQNKMSKKARNDIITKRDSLIDSIKESTEAFAKQQSIMSCIISIKYLISILSSCKNSLSKFKEIKIDESTIIDSILSNIPIKLNTNKYREYTNYITSIKATKEDLKMLYAKKEEMLSANKETITLKSVIENLNSNLVDIADSKSTIIGKIRNIESKKNEIEDEFNYISNLKQYKEQYINFSEDLKNINEEISRMNLDEYKALYDEVSALSSKLNQLNHSDIPIIRSELDKAKYQIVLYDQYKKDYKEYEDKYNTLMSLKQHSGINGIQTIYMSVFMNSILSEANSLLAHLFKGRFKLQPFIINENEFILPCIDDKGNIRPDISYMSDSQLSEISMILSFVLLHKASKLYNIIKLDEVDDNLDNENRLQFSILINKIMEMLQFDQCVLISHNDEIDLSNADLIITKIEDISYHDYLLNSGANLIADFS